MKNSSTKVMCPSPQGECEEDSTELKLHGHKTNHSLQDNGEKDLRNKNRNFKKIMSHITEMKHIHLT